MFVKFRFNEDSEHPIIKEAVHRLREHERNPCGGFFTQVEGISFHADNEGLYVIEWEFLWKVPTRLQKLPIRGVELQETGPGIQYINGVYIRKAATAVVTTYHVGSEADVCEWKIQIKGRSLEAAISLYEAIREGKARPTKNWDGGASSDDTPKRSCISRLSSWLRNRFQPNGEVESKPVV